MSKQIEQDSLEREELLLNYYKTIQNFVRASKQGETFDTNKVYLSSDNHIIIEDYKGQKTLYTDDLKDIKALQMVLPKEFGKNATLFSKFRKTLPKFNR